MSASLVGSEMCIRDSQLPVLPCPQMTAYISRGPPSASPPTRGPSRARPVSYTHLTLPTICSV
eukprot:10413982-Alexandrium_andersonii.AAC.1